MSQPLLSTGNFGVHLLSNPSGTYSFFGTVPCELSGAFADEEEGLSAFCTWFKGLAVDKQRDLVGDLRNDIFERVFTINI